MILLSIYALTILFCWLTMFCFLLEVTVIVREKGYIIPSDPNKFKLFVVLFKVFIISCIPLFNVLLGFVYLFSDDVKNKVVEKYKPKGEI